MSAESSTQPISDEAASVSSTRSTRILEPKTETLDSLEGNAATRLFLFEHELRNENIGDEDFKDEPVRNEEVKDEVAEDENVRVVEPWFLEMASLRRFNFLDINNQLASLKKKIYEDQAASAEDMASLRTLLHDQGTLCVTEPPKQWLITTWRTVANAIRDFEYVRSLDFLTDGEKAKRHFQSNKWFRDIGYSDKNIDPFESGAYRRLRNTRNDPYRDEIQKILLTYLPSSITWTKEEKQMRKDLYRKKFQPKTPSSLVERLAKFLVAMLGALFILVPMYVMALQESQTKNLITTTVAVVFFAIVCSLALRTTNDQTLAATTGYAAVLMVFVGLTTQRDRA